MLHHGYEHNGATPAELQANAAKLESDKNKGDQKAVSEIQKGVQVGIARYEIRGPIVLGFIENEQADIIFDASSGGTIESDGRTVWYTKPDGNRYESTTTPDVIDAALERGDIAPVGASHRQTFGRGR